jgi:hypothetical protein
VENRSEKPNPSKELFSMPDDDRIADIQRRLTNLENRVAELEDAVFEEESEEEGEEA